MISCSYDYGWTCSRVGGVIAFPAAGIDSGARRRTESLKEVRRLGRNARRERRAEEEEEVEKRKYKGGSKNVECSALG